MGSAAGALTRTFAIMRRAKCSTGAAETSALIGVFCDDTPMNAAVDAQPRSADPVVWESAAHAAAPAAAAPPPSPHRNNRDQVAALASLPVPKA